MKDFSYMFYPGDVLRDTQFFTDAQKGCYLSILCCHIENIRISYDLLMIITRSLNEFERNSFLKIFDKDDDGYFLNWAVNAIEKRSDFIKSRSNNKSGRKKNEDIILEEKEIIKESYDLHMVNENKKEKEIKIKKEYEQELETLLFVFNQCFKTNFRTIETLKENYAHWRTIYEPQEIEQAIVNASKDDYWKSILKPETIFRQKNQNREKVDYIGQFLNLKPKGVSAQKQEMHKAFRDATINIFNKL